MATLSELVTQRDELLAALADPTRSVTDSSGESVTFRSTGEIRAALAAIDAEIAAIRAGRRATPSIVYPVCTKGL